MTRPHRLRVWATVLMALQLALLSGCGSDDSAPSDAAAESQPAPPPSSAATQSSGESEAASPTASSSATPPAVATAEQSRPTGTYSVVRTIVELTQENAETSAGAVGDTDKFTVRFSAGECDVDGCVGKARSSGGAVYAFAWDGAALVLSRKDDRIETSCGNQGTVQTLHEFSFEPVQVTGTPTSRPDEMRVRMIDDARIVPDTATDDCDLSLAGDVSYTFELVLSAT